MRITLNIVAIEELLLSLSIVNLVIAHESLNLCSVIELNGASDCADFFACYSRVRRSYHFSLK